MCLYLDDKPIRHNWAFTLYFSLMFCLYTYTYIQLFIQLGIIAYVMLSYTDIKTIYIRKSNIKNMIFYVAWFGLLVLAFYLSTRFWAYSSYAESKTMLSVFRIFAIGFVIFLYSDSRERIYAVLQSFIIGCAIMGIVAIVTSVALGYGFGNTQFGSAIGQHRNQIGAISAPMVYLCYFLNKEFSFKYGKFLCGYFVILALMTGSLTTIVQTVLIGLLITVITSKDVKKIITRIVIVAVLAVFVLLIIRNIPYLNEHIWDRIVNVTQTMSGEDEFADTSALGRQSYKEIAFMMFLDRPLLGYGLDGFYCYLRDNSTIMGFHMSAVYSHCNYAELAADLGMLGLIIWYLPVLSVLKSIWKSVKYRKWSCVLFAIFASMVLSDYSRIPWETHMIMYLWFIIILLCRNEAKEYSLSLENDINDMTNKIYDTGGDN